MKKGKKDFLSSEGKLGGAEDSIGKSPKAGKYKDYLGIHEEV